MRLHDPDFCLQERLTLIHRRRREYVQEHILIFSGTIDGQILMASFSDF